MSSMSTKRPTDIALSNATIAENSPVGTVVGTLSTTDTDAGDSHTYTLLDDAGGLFGNAGDSIVVVGLLDYETQTSHTIVVRVADAGGLTLDIIITINVINIADTPPVIQPPAGPEEPIMFEQELGPPGEVFTVMLDIPPAVIPGGGIPVVVASFVPTDSLDPQQFDTNRVHVAINLDLSDSAGNPITTFDEPLCFEISINPNVFPQANAVLVQNALSPGGFSPVPTTFIPGPPPRLKGLISHLSIVATGVNQPPTASGQSVTTVEDTDIPITLTGSDPDGDLLTFSVESSPASGTLSGTSPNLTYTPNLNFNGIDNLTFKANDGGVDSNEETISITVNTVNDAPTVANPVTNVTANEEAADTVIDLTGVFADVDIATSGDVLSRSVVNSNPALLTETITGTSLTLDYLDDQNGTATLIVRATDSGGLFVESQFTATVTPVNDAPTVATPITDVTTAEDAADTVIDLAGVFADVDIATSGDVLTHSVVNSKPALLAETLTGTSLTLDYLDDQNGTATLTVRATDSGGLFVESQFAVTVNPDNDAPTVATPITAVTTAEDAADTVIDLTGAFADVDIATDGDVLTHSVVNSNPDLLAETLTGTSLTLDYLDEQNGIATLTVQATDSGGLFVESQFTVTVNPDNDAPTVATPITDVTTAEDAADTAIDLVGAFADVDIVTSGDVLTHSVVNSNPALLAETITGTSLTLDYLGEQNGTATLTVRATDSGGLFVESQFAVTVNPDNDAPTVATPITAVTTAEDAADTVIDLTGAFADVDIATDGDVLTHSVVNSNPALLAETLTGTSLTLDYLDEQNGIATLTVRATDSGGLFVESQFTVTVNPDNDAPTVATPITDVTTAEDAADTVIDLVGAFADVDIVTSGDVLTHSVVNSNPALLTETITGTSLTLDYLDDQGGTATLTVRATDSGGLFVESQFTATVNPGNDAPTIATPITDVAVDEDAADAVVDLTGVFADVDIATSGDVLTHSVVNSNPALLTETLTGTSLTLDYLDDQNGTATLTVRATDSGGLFVESQFTATVNPDNDAPTIATPITDVTTAEDTADMVIDLTGVFADVDTATDGDVLALNAANSNPFLLTATLTGISLTLDYLDDQGGTATLTVRATDSGGLFVESQFTVTVNPGNDAPTIATLITDVTTTEDAADTVIDLTGVFADVDIATNGDVLTHSVVNSNPALLAETLTGTSLTLDYLDDQNGTATLTVRATDSGGLFVESQFTVTVSPGNDAPTIATPITDVTTAEDAADTVIDLTGIFADVDIATSGDALTLSIVNSDPLLLTETLTGASLTLDYLDDQNGTATLTVRATDSGGLFVESQFTVTVNPDNDAPTVTTPITDITTAEDAADTAIDLTGIFADVDIATNGDVLTHSVVNSNPVLLTEIVTGASLTLDYLDNQNGTATLTVQATDSGGFFVESQFTATANPVNDAPTVANPIADVAVDEDAADTVIDLTGAFADVDIATNGDTLTLSTTNSNTTLLTATLVGTGLTLDYLDNQQGQAALTVTATDSGSPALQISRGFTVTVNPVNDLLVVNSDAFNVDEDRTLIENVLINDSDIDLSDVLTASLVTGVSNGAFNLNSNGVFTYTPTLNFNGTDNFTYLVSDGSGGSGTATASITVAPANDPPAAIDDTANTDAETPVTVNVLINDSDIDADSLTVDAVTQGVNGSVTNNGDGTVTYTPNPGFASGTDSFTYSVSDGNGGTDTATVTVGVTDPANVPPVVEAGPDATADEGNTVSLTPASFTDFAGDTHTTTINWGDGTLLESGVVDDAADTVSGSHIYLDNGIYTVRGSQTTVVVSAAIPSRSP